MTRDTTTKQLPPGKPGHPLVGNLLEAWRDPLHMLTESRRVYGPTVRFHFGPLRYVCIHREADIRHVLVQHRDNYPKSVNYRGLKLVLGEGLVTSEGETWRRQRKLAQPGFHHQSLVGFAATMAECTAAMLERWDARDASEPFDVHDEMMRLTFRIVGRTLCSVDLDGVAADMGQAITVALHFAEDYAESAVRIPMWLPTPRNIRFRRALGRLDGLILGIIEERRRSGETKGDLLDMLMRATDETGTERMDDRQLRDELMTLVMAGHETTAVALSWAWYLLSKHPDVARAVQREARAVLGERPATFRDLADLRYTGRVIDEAMRLYPPVWIFERQAIAEDEIDGFRIPEKTIVGIPIWSLHRDPAHWDNPEGFDPDRFLPHRAEGRGKYAYMPFGGGPRICIGNHFALMEAKIILAMVAARYRLDLVPGHAIVPEPTITLRPKHGIHVLARRQEACKEPAAAA